MIRARGPMSSSSDNVQNTTRRPPPAAARFLRTLGAWNTMRKPWMFAAVPAFLAVGGLGAFAWQGQGEGQAPAAAPAAQEQEVEDAGGVQPIAFPHNVHVQTYQMECQYCHFSAERSVDAGIPPVQVCAGCHQAIPGAQNPQEVAKVMDAWRAGETIPWVRIYKVADHVHFPHMRHVGVAQISCQECHGPVETMGAIEEKDPAWGGDNMGWCISCHVERGASRDCTVCHY